MDKKGKLIDDEHRHCAKVLRKNVGDEILVFTGDGSYLTAQITKFDKEATHFEIKKTTETPKPKANVGIAIAPTKSADRIEWFVEKAVEIGISTIWFMHCQRSERPKINMDRIHKIVISAMKQSTNIWQPEIRYFEKFGEMLKESTLFDVRLIAHCQPDTTYLTQGSAASVLLLIGPEGDFTPQEIDESIKLGFKPTSLGPSRLRTETAGVVACCLLQHIIQTT